MHQHPHDNPVFNPIFADGAPTLPSTSTERLSQPKKPSVPPAIGRIIGELGLRYRPSSQADLEAHAEALKLLAQDLHDVPANLLEVAAKRWVRENRFMPKASELVALARGELEGRRSPDSVERQLQAHCDRLNAMPWCRDQWIVVGEAGSRRVDRKAG